MKRCSWPGNVRELRNCMELMIITAHSEVIGFFAYDVSPKADSLLSLPFTPGIFHAELGKSEKGVIQAALSEHAGEINATCQALGVSRRSLYDRMIKCPLRKEDFNS